MTLQEKEVGLEKRYNEAMKINAGELKKGDIILRHGLQLLNEPKQRD